MKINLYKVYNDFGDTLPSKGEFFNNPNNEVTRAMLKRYYKYKGVTDLRRFLWFKEEYDEFVKGLKKAKEVTKDAAK